jgi:CHAD domain-containing protein
MPTEERELRLSAPPGFRLPDLAGLVEGHAAAERPVRTLRTAYHDTSDLRLARWGRSLWHGSGQGWTVELPRPARGGIDLRRKISFRGGPKQAPREATELLRAFVRNERVGPVANLRTVRRSVEIRDGDGKCLAEVASDEVSVLDGRRIGGRFHEAQVELGMDAPDGLLDAIVERLQGAGAGGPAPNPRITWALGARAFEGPEIVLAPIDPDASAADAVTRALAASVTRLLEHDAGVRLGEDPEDVHQARVATRRLRSHLRTFEELIDAEWAQTLRGLLRELGGALGAVRDPEVLFDRLERGAEELTERDRPAADALLCKLRAERERARVRLLEVLRDPRYADLLDLLVAAAQSPPLLAAAQEPARQVLFPLIEARWQSVSNAVAKLSVAPRDEELHRIRIRAKHCRYAIESVVPLVGKPARNLARSLAALQDVLGELQDATVARAWLAASRQRGSRAQVFVAGELAGAELLAAAKARAGFERAWKRTAKRANRAWLSETC